MPGVTVKNLYLGSNVGDLNKLAGEFPKVENPRLFIKSAEKLFKGAEENALLGDEEKAYVLYMRFFNIVSAIKKTQEYKKNAQYYNDMIGMKRCLTAIDEAEKLSGKLKERYEEKEAREVSEKLEALEKKNAEREKEKELEAIKAEEEKAKEESAVKPSVRASVSAGQLYSFLLDHGTTVLVMDCRPEEDFSASHISNKSCINVPSTIIPPGCTVGQVEKQLSSEWIDAWKDRGSVDYIILLDWRSKLENLAPGTTLNNLKDALYKWDQDTVLRHEPLVLDGGYDEWLLYYPTVTTNAKIARPQQTSNIMSNIPSLDAIDYDLDADILKTEEQLRAERQVKIAKMKKEAEEKARWEAEQREKAALIAKNSTIIDKDSSKIVKPINMPSVDRSKKPMANNLNNTPLATESKPAQLGSTKMNNLVYDSDKNSAGLKQEKNTNITKQGNVEIPIQPVNKQVNVAPVKPNVNRSLKPNSNAGSKGESEKEASDEKIATPNSSPVKQAQSDSNGEKKSSKTANQAMVLEHQARVAKLEKVKEETDKLISMKKQEAEETAKLMRKKRQVEQELKKLEQDLSERHRESTERDSLMNIEVQPPDSDKSKDDSDGRLSISDLEKSQQDQDDKASSLRKAQEEEKKKEAERLEQEANKKAQEKALREKAEKEAMARIEREEKERREKMEREKRDEEEKKRQALRAQIEAEEERKRKEERERKRKEEEAKKQKEKEILADKSIKDNKPQGTHHTPGLPVGWEKRLDPATGRYYYINHRDKHTQWNPPTPVIVPKKVAEDSGDVYKTRLKDEVEQSTAGGLKRSRSTPNIAKIAEDEKVVHESKPEISRTSKPKVENRDIVTMTINTDVPVSKLRSLNPIPGNVRRGLSGLRNLGNTCYLNSTIQCLSNTVPLSVYFLSDNYKHHINRDNIFGQGGLIAEEYAVVIKGLWSGQYRSVAPMDLWMVLGKFYSLFASHEHQDSQELLLFLLDGLHEDLNQVKKRPQLPEQKNDNIPDLEAAKIAWEMHKKINRSVIVELFQGQFKSTVMCLECGKKSVTFDVFVNLSLPIPSTSRCSLADCIAQFSKEERMTGESKWDCPQCKRKRNAVKNIRLWKLPPVLVVQLKRFYYRGASRDKITSYVDFPIDSLDMGQYSAGPRPVNNYTLYGVSNHYGSLDGGHYTASVKNPNNKRWYKYDDSDVSEMSKSDIKSSAAFILFYTCVDMGKLLE